MRIGLLFGMLVIFLTGCNVSQEVLPATSSPSPVQELVYNAAAFNELPPIKYRGPASVVVVYVDDIKMNDICSSLNAAACTFRSKDVIFLPTRCSPTKIETAQREFIEPEVLLTQPHTFCVLTKVHEVGHVNGWSGFHEESTVFAVVEEV